MPFADFYYTGGILHLYCEHFIFLLRLKKLFLSIKISNENNNTKREQNQFYFYFFIRYNNMLYRHIVCRVVINIIISRSIFLFSVMIMPRVNFCVMYMNDRWCSCFAV